MPDQLKIKGKHKRGERSSVEEEVQQGSKRTNMADAEFQLTTKHRLAPTKKKSRQAIMPGRQVF